MERRIAVVNQKGGVGKTVTTLNLAHALALMGNRVLALDLDPQGQLGQSFGVAEGEYAGLDNVLLKQGSLENARQNVREGVDIVLAGPTLAEVERLSEGGASRGRRLGQALEGAEADCDFLLMDCPPSAGLLMVNALFACDEVLIPVAGDYLALSGLSRLLRTLQSYERMAKRSLKRWLVLTRYRPQGRLARAVSQHLADGFPRELLATPIRENISLAESPGFGKTIFEYRAGSTGAADYEALADDLVSGRGWKS